MPLIVPISSVTSFGIEAAAARSSELLNEPVRRLPEGPRFVVMSFTSRLRSGAGSLARWLRAVAEIVVNRPPTSRRSYECVGRSGAARAGLVDFRRVAHVQQGLDDAPGFEHAVLA